jgi:hypothetical protein
MNITSNNTMIFKKEDNGKIHYRAGLSTKKQDGSYDKAYIDVRMPKDTTLDNKTKINITKGFLSFYNYTDKEEKSHTIWYVVVQEYTLADEIKEQEVYKVESYDDESLQLPF